MFKRPARKEKVREEFTPSWNFNSMSLNEKPIQFNYSSLPSSIWKSIFILSSQQHLQVPVEELPLIHPSVTTYDCHVDCVSHRPYQKKSIVESRTTHNTFTKSVKVTNLLMMSEEIDEEKLFVIFQVCKAWRIVVYELVSRLFNSKLNGNSSWGLKILRHFTNIIALNLSFNRYDFSSLKSN